LYQNLKARQQSGELMNQEYRILIVEDLPSDAMLAQHELKQALPCFTTKIVETESDFLAALETFAPHLIISDFKLPAFDGLTVIKLVLEKSPLTPVIILTGSMNEDTAVACIKAGATDYVIKEHIKRLGSAVINALKQKKIKAERIQARAALKESEARFRRLAENAEDLIYRYEFSPRRGFTYVSPIATKITGYTPAEHYADPDLGFKLVHPDDRHLVERATSNPADSRKPLTLRWLKKDGTLIWIEQRNIPILDDQGNIVAIEGIARDVTERMSAEEALRESEAKLKKAQHYARLGSWTWNIKTNQLDWSDEMFRIFGLDKETFTGSLETVIAQAIHPDDRLKVEQSNLSVINDKKPIPLEYRIIWPDQSVHVVWAEAGELLLDEVGNPSILSGTVQDITQRKQDEAAMRLQSAALNAAANAIVITDLNGIIQWVNPAFCELTGYTATEAIGKNQRALVKSGHHDRAFYKNLWDTILAGQVWRGEIINRRKDGTLYTEEETVTPVSDAKGEISHFIGIKQDITSRKALEAENQKLTEQVYQAQKMESIGNLAGGIAHDFNNLLVPIVGYAELGMMMVPPDSKVYTHFEQIKGAGERAASLTRQILAFSRRQLLEITMIDLNQVIVEFEKMLQRLIGEDIVLKTHLADDLPTIKADQGQLEQILLNLVVNARDAMPDGGQLTIETAPVVLDEAYVARHAQAQPGPHVLLAVSDTGHGMDAITRQRIFEPFFTTKPRGHGTGLGLSTVFGIVKQHGGNIWVYSEPGQGTTFKVYLPTVETLTSTDQPEQASIGYLEGVETILVVEDEAAVRELVNSTLQLYGYRVLEAEDPVRGLELATAYRDHIHLLLTDVVMPVMNGRELFQRLAADRRDLKVLYMSGYTDNAIAHHGVLDEGTVFLQKPFTVRRLLEKVRAVLR
jgi:PAS domain S-box-containing protein